MRALNLSDKYLNKAIPLLTSALIYSKIESIFLRNAILIMLDHNIIVSLVF